jgi:LacI family transcriptional regulator
MRISERTRERVLEVARALDYHPDASGRRLVTGQTNIIAYVERQNPEQAFADAIMPQVLRGVHDASAAMGYEVLFAPIPLETGDGRFSRLLRGHHVDGIILSGPRSDDVELRQLLELPSPIVLQGQWPELQAASVDVNNVDAGLIATEHLIQLGHNRIAMIVHAPEYFTGGAERLKGYRQALESNRIEYDESLVTFANFTPNSGEKAMAQLLSQTEQPSAIFISSDTVAIGAMRVLRQHRLRIPEDIAVVGFDDIPMAVYFDPPLTTIRLPAYGLGWAAADLLISRINSGESRDTTILLETELVIRGSSGVFIRD